jgi:simple sugar transport system substrate-binding protein
MRRFVTFASVAFLLLTAACKLETTPQPKRAESFVFGVILVGPNNDHGWSEAHFAAGRYVESKLPNAQMIYVDNVNPAAKPGVTIPQLVDELVAKGAKIVFTTSEDFQDGTLEAALKHPELPIVNCSGDMAWKDGKNFKAPKNLSNSMGRMEYGEAIAGFAAALTTRTGKLGYLGPLINDETRRLAVATFLGARYAWTEVLKKDPRRLKFKVTWIGFWFNIPGQTLDPTKVSDAFYNTGYDVVISGIDTTECVVEGGKIGRTGRQVWAIPYNYRGGCAEAEEICLGAPYFNWGPAYLKAVQLVIDDKWTQYWEWNGPDWSDLNNPDTSAVGFVKGKALTAENAAKVDAFTKGLADGSIQLFEGPLNFQDDTPYLKEGERADDQEIWYFPQLLRGMEGVGGK